MICFGFGRRLEQVTLVFRYLLISLSIINQFITVNVITNDFMRDHVSLFVNSNIFRRFLYGQVVRYDYSTAAVFGNKIPKVKLYFPGL